MTLRNIKHTAVLKLDKQILVSSEVFCVFFICVLKFLTSSPDYGHKTQFVHIRLKETLHKMADNNYL